MWGPNPSLLREKLGVGVSSQLYGALLTVGFMTRVCLSLSYVFLCGYFLSHQMFRSRPACFWISFRGNLSTHSCTFTVSMGRVELRSLLCCHLGWLSSWTPAWDILLPVKKKMKTSFHNKPLYIYLNFSGNVAWCIFFFNGIENWKI